MEKKLIVPALVRKVPQGNFSWIDQRLVRDRYTTKMSAEAAALYLFLVIVADREGLSYYSDQGVLKCLLLSAEALHEARQALVRLKLIAYQKPLYQVLSLQPSASPAAARRDDRAASEPACLGAVLRRIMEGKAS